MSENSRCIAIILLSVAIICALCITVPLYFIGYKDGLKKNAELRNTTCIVYRNDDIRPTTCSRECNCRTEYYVDRCYTYDNNGNAHSYSCTKSEEVCDTCDYTCYQGFYYFYYWVGPKFFNLSYNDLDAIEVGKNYTMIAGGVRYDTVQLTRNYLSNYPIGLTWPCFFNIHDHTIVLDKLYEPETYYVIYVVFLIISLFICCLSIIYGVASCCEIGNKSPEKANCVFATQLC